MAKATKKQMYMREVEMQQYMAEGKSRSEIFERCSVNWGVSPRTVETMYLRLVKNIEKLVLEGREELRATLMAKNEFLYQQALCDGKLKTALDANMAQAKLAGLFDEKKTDATKSKPITIGERAPLEVVPDKKAENE